MQRAQEARQNESQSIFDNESAISSMVEDFFTPPVINIFEYYFEEGKSMDEILDILFKEFHETHILT
jgi:hypothetical protein